MGRIHMEEEMKKKKKKMSTKKNIAIFTPVLLVLTGAMIALTCVANVYSSALDTYLGRGNKVINNTDSSSTWNTKYYENKFTSTGGDTGSQAAAAKVAKSIADEGTVVLKNNGALPLAKESNVAPFGYRYMNPFYGGSGSGNVVTTDAYVVSPEKALDSNFNVANTFEGVSGTTDVRKYYYDTTAGNDVLYYFDWTNTYNGSDQSIYEFDKSVYKTSNITSSATTGIVFLGRSGGENNDLFSIPYNKVGNVQASAAGTAAAGISKVRDAESTDKVKHALDLMPEEEETLQLAKTNCDKVVVVINSSNAMELGSLADDTDIDAIIWVGGPGAKGFQSMSDILAGEVNPSGKTVDVFVRDVKEDPTYKNIGDVDGFAYTNTNGLAPMGGKQYSDSRKASNPFEYIEYEEGVYMGYKYYETAYDTKLSDFSYGELNADGSTKTEGQVVYPFGYGLSYTTFKKEITSFKGNENEVTVEVKVTNTGNVAGKDVAQIYYTAPYTDLDKELGVEKPTALLAAFEKTKVLAPNESEILKLKFDTDDMASYSYKHENSDKTKGCYMLDKGTYHISLRNNSHDVVQDETFDIGSTIYFDNDNPRQSEKDAQSALDDNGNATSVPAKAKADTKATFEAATNNFEESTKYMTDSSLVERLTRGKDNGLAVSNLVAGKKEKEAPNWVVENLQEFDVATDTELGNVEGSKVYHAEDPLSSKTNNQSITNFRGVDYFDPLWDELLNQIDYSSSELLTLMFKDQYCISPLSSIGLSASKSLDGPQGLTINSAFGATDLSTCAWPTEPIVAATFNLDLAYAYGDAVGQECLTIGNTGWYAPGCDTHRTAFSGRNFEYYSEDGVLAGKMCAAVTSGAGNQGVTCYVKHFALNDNETNRANICVWADEQTMREIYLKPFEIYVKESRMTIDYIADGEGNHKQKVVRGATGMMTSYNYVGTTFSSGSYSLVTKTLRDEWGFQGAVISDMSGGSAKRRDQTMRSGNDYILYFMQVNATDTTSSSAKWAMRNSVHHIAYALANSNWMNEVAPGAIVTYTTSPWRIGLTTASVIVYVFVAGFAAWMVIRAFKAKKDPENYNN